MSPTSYQTAPPRVAGADPTRSTASSIHRSTVRDVPWSWRSRDRSRAARHDGAVGGELVVAERVERAVVALAIHAQQLDSRIERLERLERRIELIEEREQDETDGEGGRP